MINAEAIEMIRGQLSLNDNPSTWSYEDRTRYNNALAAYEQANPDQFSGADLATIDRVAGTQYQELDDTSFLGGIGDFGNALVDEAAAAGNAVGGVGRGVLNTFSLSAYLIPLAVIAAIVIGLFALKKKIA